MATKLIIDGNAVYEIDEDCLKYRQKLEQGQKNVGVKRNSGMNYQIKKDKSIPQEES